MMWAVISIALWELANYLKTILIISLLEAGRLSIMWAVISIVLH